MLTNKQIKEMRNFLNKSENPLFLFDDDPDGTSSYLLLKKYANKGKGIMVKAEPKVSQKFLTKVREYSPDCIFILDMPIVDQEFIDNVNVPIIWLDHHQPIKRRGVNYYNPRIIPPKDNRPTTYYAYKVAEEQNTWIAAIGTFADWHYPDFAHKLKILYPGLLPKKITKKPEEVLFNSRLGDLIRIVSFLLKDNIININDSIDKLSKIESPFEILDQSTKEGKYLYTKVKGLKKEYDSAMKKVLEIKPEKGVIFVEHPKTKHSFTSELATELSYRTRKILIIAREDRGRMKMSIRSSKIHLPNIIQEALIGLDGYGGGHELACGASIKSEDFPLFLERFKNLINK